MKKLLIGISAALCAVIMGACLAACAPDAKDVTSIEVTEEEWNAAFEYLYKDDAVYTMTSISQVEIRCVDGTITGCDTYICNRNKNKTKDAETLTYDFPDSLKEMAQSMFGSDVESGKTAEVETYGEAKDGEYYDYYKVDGKWIKSKGYVSYELLSRLLSGNNMSYSYYEFNAEKKGYVRNDLEDSSESPVVKFGKVGDEVRLIAVYTLLNNTQGEISQTAESNVTISYSSPEITLPTVEE